MQDMIGYLQVLDGWIGCLMMLMYLVVMSSGLEMGIWKWRRLHDLVCALGWGSLIFCRWTPVYSSQMR